MTAYLWPLQQFLLCILAFHIPVYAASQAPDVVRVQAIEFEGNDDTDEKLLRQELLLREGDTATPEQIEQSRQALQDLGLFKTVKVQRQPVEGGVKLRFLVKEKRYFLLIPRLGVNSDGETTVGLAATISNMFGTNQRLKLRAQQKYLEDERSGTRSRYSVDYQYPEIIGSLLGLGVSARYSQSPTDLKNASDQTIGHFDQQSRALAVTVGRRFGRDANRRRFRSSTGLSYSDFSFVDEHNGVGEDRIGGGRALAASAGLSFDNVHDKRYSETGLEYSFEIQSSVPVSSSHYNFTQQTLRLKQFWPGWGRHHNLNVGLELRNYGGGPAGYEPYQLGGMRSLRAYDDEDLEGSALYLIRSEYLLPLFGWDQLRGLAFVDVGNIFPTWRDVHLRRTNVSTGLGIRWRIEAFVNLELNLGYGYAFAQNQGRVLFGTGGF